MIQLAASAATAVVQAVGVMVVETVSDKWQAEAYEQRVQQRLHLKLAQLDVERQRLQAAREVEAARTALYVKANALAVVRAESRDELANRLQESGDVERFLAVVQLSVTAAKDFQRQNC